MCINLETSIFAFIIGGISGLILTTLSKERRLIGLFVMFYSLIQFLEANIYYLGSDPSSIYSRLILINLGLQGLVFFILMNQIFIINNFYLISCAIISIYTIYQALSSNFKKVEISKCLTWNFMNKNYYSLFLMYAIMFIWLFSKKTPRFKNISIDFINNSRNIFVCTLIISYFLLNYKNSPSIWCLSSAIVAPLFLII